MVGGENKFKLLRASSGLIFPVRWHEPFGLAIIESLYFGCPVFAIPYGALPELVSPGCGHLSDRAEDLAEAIACTQYDPRQCQAQALQFNADKMTKNYLRVYERILSGETLHHTKPQVLDVRQQLPWS